MHCSVWPFVPRARPSEYFKPVVSARWVRETKERSRTKTCQRCGHPAILHGRTEHRCELCVACPGLYAPGARGAAAWLPVKIVEDRCHVCGTYIRDTLRFLWVCAPTARRRRRIDRVIPDIREANPKTVLSNLRCGRPKCWFVSFRSIGPCYDPAPQCRLPLHSARTGTANPWTWKLCRPSRSEARVPAPGV